MGEAIYEEKKILFDSHLLINGGVENVLQNIVIYLHTKGDGEHYAVTVAAIPERSEDFHAVYPSDVHFVQREKVRKGYKRYTLRWLIDTLICRLYDFIIYCYLNLRRYDVAVSITTGRTMLRSSRMRATHKFCWVQRDYREFRPWGKSYVFRTPEAERRCMQRFDKVVCVSESARDGIVETMGDPGNLCVKYNPIHVSKIRSLAREDCGVEKKPGRFLIVSVGRLHPEKQFLLLLKLFQALSDGRELELWIIGDGEERAKLEEFIRHERLSNVRLFGYQANPYAYLAQADLCVSCSCSEAYGLVVQEALILNVPVAAIRCSGIVESLDPRFGVLVDNDFEKMKEALADLIDHPEKLERFRERIKAEFPFDHLYEERLEAICQLWDEPGKATQPPAGGLSREGDPRVQRHGLTEIGSHRS